MRRRTPTELVTLATAFIVAVGGLVEALRDLPAKVQRLADVLTLRNAVWMVLFLGGSWVLARLLRPRSRPLVPDAFIVRQNEVRHLQGREGDIENVAGHCANHAQVNLTGESGVGKSTLVSTGLLPRLAGRGLLAVYVSDWGRDWISGPARALRLALNRDARLTGCDSIADAERRAVAAGMRLLLIFDQFDDYQNAHSERFRGDGGALILPQQLMEANPFWREIGEAVVAGDTHVLFVTADAKGTRLESVRFTTPATYPLDRLPVAEAKKLIDALVASADAARPVIADEANGWSALRDRLLSDLGAAGAVLPIQMKVALECVSNLDYLTVREYERHGGLHGLEAARIWEHVQNATHRHGIAEKEAFAILRDMVETDGRATRARTLGDLVQASGAAEERVAAVLEEWTAKELIRVRADASWSLHHDYAAGGVLAAESRFDSGRKLLDERESDFRASGTNLWRRWRTLLPPAEQLRLAGMRLRGRMRYRGRRAYAALSLSRFLPYAAVAAALIVVPLRFLSLERERDASRWLSPFGSVTSASASPDEAQALRELSQAPQPARLAFLDLALSSPGGAQKLQAHLRLLLNALQATTDDRMHNLVVHRLRFRLTHDAQPDIQNAAASALVQLHAVDFQTLLVAFRQTKNRDLAYLLAASIQSEDCAAILGSDPQASMKWFSAVPQNTAALTALAMRCGQAAPQPPLVGAELQAEDDGSFLRRAKSATAWQNDSAARRAVAAEFVRRFPPADSWAADFLAVSQSYGVAWTAPQIAAMRTSALGLVTLDSNSLGLTMPPAVTFAEASDVVRRSKSIFVPHLATLLNAMNPDDAARLWDDVAGKVQFDISNLSSFKSYLAAPVLARIGPQLDARGDASIDASGLRMLISMTDDAKMPANKLALRAALIRKGSVEPLTKVHDEDAYALVDAVEAIHKLGGNAEPVAIRLRERILDAFLDPDIDINAGHAVEECARYFAAADRKTIGERAKRALMVEGRESKLETYVRALCAVGESEWVTSPAVVEHLRPSMGTSLSIALAPYAAKLPADVATTMARQIVTAAWNDTSDVIAICQQHKDGAAIRESVRQLLPGVQSPDVAANVAIVIASAPDLSAGTLLEVGRQPLCVDRCRDVVLDAARKRHFEDVVRALGSH